MKLEITRQESVTVTPCHVAVSQPALLAKLGLPEDAEFTLVDANGEHAMPDDWSFIITFVERKAKRVRAPK